MMKSKPWHTAKGKLYQVVIKAKSQAQLSGNKWWHRCYPLKVYRWPEEDECITAEVYVDPTEMRQWFHSADNRPLKTGDVLFYRLLETA